MEMKETIPNPCTICPGFCCSQNVINICGYDAWVIARALDIRPTDFLAFADLGGEEMPIDSVLGAAVLARLEQRYGVSLPASAETAPALRSVRAFAAAIRSLIEAELPRQAQGA